MSSVSPAGVIAAAATLYFTGGNFAAATFAYSLASGIESVVLPETVEGPRLQDRKIQLSTYGVQIPIAYGSNRLAGNVIWPKNFSLTERSHSESSKGGPDTTTFNYTATFALLLCEGPIQNIGRIWMNKKLVYDPTSLATTDPCINIMRTYLGTETQEPDPLMVATDGSAPAYRGYAYLVFEELELTNSGFGNRPPFIEVEINVTIPCALPVIYETVPYPLPEKYQWNRAISYNTPHNELWTVIRVPDGVVASVVTYTHYIRRTNATTGAFVSDIYLGHTGMHQILAYEQDPTTGEIWVVLLGTTFSRYPAFLIKISVDGVILLDRNTCPSLPSFDVAGEYEIGHIFFHPQTGSLRAYAETESSTRIMVLNKFSGAISTSSVVSPGLIFPAQFTTDAVGDVYATDNLGASPGRVVKINQYTGAATTILTLSGNNQPSLIVTDTDLNLIWIVCYSDVRVYDPVAAAIVNTFYINAVPISSEAGHALYYDRYHKQFVSVLGNGLIQLIKKSNGVITATSYAFHDTTCDLTSYASSSSVVVTPAGYYVPVTNGGDGVIGLPLYASGIAKIIFDAGLVAVNPNLGQIVTSLCTRVPYGLDELDIDTTGLSDEVTGYLIGQQMPRRAAIEQLTAAYFFDAVESDHIIKFVKRGSNPIVNIPQDDRAAHEDGSELPAHLSLVRASELELPWTIDVKYADKDRDYQVGTQYARRITRNANDPRSIELAIVMTAAKAAQVALVNLYQPWLRTLLRFSTTFAYSQYEPTDVVTLPTDEVTYVARITSRNDQGNGVILWEAALEDVNIYSQEGAVVATSNFAPQTIANPGSTTLELLDMPILRDVDDNPGFYVAMAGITTDWRGAQLYKSSDSGSTYTSIVSSTTAATIGTTQTTLADFTAGNIFDNGNTVSIVLSSGGPLISATQDQVLNGSNTAIIGAPDRWEVINFKTATLTATNTYLLSGLLRGRRGTEWATGLHTSADTFVLASLASWRRVNPGSAELGLARLYKAPPFRTTLAAATAQSFTDNGIGLKPYAPVDLNGARDNSSNLTITWHRRSRIGYGTLNAIVPLGETTASYSVDIMNGATVLRTIASATQTATYSAANQITDYGSTQSSISVNVYQISATVGRGYVLHGII